METIDFDLVGARNAGYSYGEIADGLSAKANFDVDGARKAGYSSRDIALRLSNAKIENDRVTPADVRAEARAKGIDPDFVHALIVQESGGNDRTKDSPKGAVGIGQVMPATFTSMMGPDADIRDPWQNLEAGLKYMRYGADKLGIDASKLDDKTARLLAAGYHQGYDKPELQRGQIANTNDSMIATPRYAESIFSRYQALKNSNPDSETTGNNARAAQPDPVAKSAPPAKYIGYNDYLRQARATPEGKALDEGDIAEKWVKTYGEMTPPSTKRTGVEAVTDVVKAAAQGVGGVVEGVGTLYGLASGNMQNWLRELGKDTGDYWEAQKSEGLKTREEQRKEKIDSAESNAGKFGQAIWQTIKDPALLSTIIGQNLPMMLPAAAVGRTVGMAGRALGASEGVARGAEVAASIGSGAILQGADVASDSYKDAMSLPQAMWDKNQGYRELAGRVGADKAKDMMSQEIALRAGVYGALVSAGVNSLPGMRNVEKLLMGRVGGSGTGVFKGAVTGTLKESGTESIEEGSGKFFSNQQIRDIDTQRPLDKDVAESAGLGAAGGGPFGAVAGGFAGSRPDIAQPPPNLGGGTGGGGGPGGPGGPGGGPNTGTGTQPNVGLLTQNAAGTPPPTVTQAAADLDNAKTADEAVAAAAAMTEDLSGQAAREARRAEKRANGLEFKELMDSEQADLDARLQAQRQEYLKKQSLIRESELESVQGRVLAQRILESRNSRFDILDGILAQPGITDPLAKFEAELKRNGYQNALAKPEEREHAQRHADIAGTFNQEDVIPSAPNEMDASLIREARARGPATTAPAAKPTFQGQPNERLPIAPVGVPAVNANAGSGLDQPGGNGQPNGRLPVGERAPEGVAGNVGAAGNAVKVDPIDQGINPVVDGRGGIQLQNRDRSSPASIAQMQSIAGNPDPARLSFSRDLTSGSPVVFYDDDATGGAVLGKSESVTTSSGRKISVRYAAVEAGSLLASHKADGSAVPEYANPSGKARAVAGNGRLAGIKESYARGTPSAYIDGIANDSQLHGVPAAAIKAMKNPVLVRVMGAKDVTANIGDESNVASGAALDPVEQARTDVRRIKLESLEFDEEGRLTVDALRRFVQAMPATEQSGLLQRDGSPSAQAVDRLTAAIFAQAYNDNALTELAAQAIDSEAKSIVSALTQAAPSMIKLEGAQDLDIRGAVRDAARLAINARRRGVKLETWIAQGDIELSAETRIVATMFAKNIRSAKAIAAKLIKMAEYAYTESSKAGFDMLGEVQRASRAQVIGVMDDTPRQENLEQPGRSAPNASNDGRQGNGQAGRGNDKAAGGVEQVQAEQTAAQAEVAPKPPEEIATKEVANATPDVANATPDVANAPSLDLLGQSPEEM
ncbi:LT_GEWL domain containing protein, partial [uncultured Caudovirales phage]